jgi:putative methyltransferase (TIGR04325 family)
LIWSGVYQNFDQIDESGSKNGYVNRVWIDKSIERLNKIMSSDIAKIDLSEVSTCDVLFLKDFIAKNFTSDINVIDFGGNLGQTGIAIKKLLQKFAISWKVIEHAEFLLEIQKLIKLPNSIEFDDKIDSAQNESTHLAYFGSSFQYISDWTSFLDNFLAIYQPKFLIISDAYMSSEIKSFCTAQKYYEDILPCWFLNLNDFSNKLKDSGYKLMYQDNFITKKNKNYHPESNLPVENQIQNTLNLIFEKIDIN